MSKKARTLNVHVLLHKIQSALDAAPINGEEASKVDWNLHRQALANARGGVKLLADMLALPVTPLSCIGGLPELDPTCDLTDPLIK